MRGHEEIGDQVIRNALGDETGVPPSTLIFNLLHDVSTGRQNVSTASIVIRKMIQTGALEAQLELKGAEVIR